jgi:hypothetical protein
MSRFEDFTIEEKAVIEEALYWYVTDRKGTFTYQKETSNKLHTEIIPLQTN